MVLRALADELFENPISRSMVGTRELYLRSQLYCSLTDTLLPVPDGADLSTELPPRTKRNSDCFLFTAWCNGVFYSLVATYARQAVRPRYLQQLVDTLLKL
jgi:hypothetical protein